MVFQPTTFGRYVLLKRIAIGGMAEIFRAIAYGAEGFEKVVAIKRMLPHLSSDHQFVDMFINEAKLAASLNHANIVQIYDFGCIDNLLFLSMEYVHGKDISEITGGLRTRQLSTPVELACHVFIEVLNGLHHAHRQRDRFGNPLNLVHRDMSPPNIIVSYDGEVKIADFGIAKATRTKIQTSSGVLKGKYSYMSPEQADGKLLDRRTDIFSLGICFYEMITLTEAFSGHSELEVLRKVRSAEVRKPREINPLIPDQLENILLKALAKNPDERYPSAAEFRDALEKFLAENNLRFSTSALAGFVNDIFQADIMKEREQLAHEAQTAEDLRPEARSIARLEATAAGELDTLVIEKEESAWPPGFDHLDQGSFGEEESGDETTIRVDLAQLGLDDPYRPATTPAPPAALSNADLEDFEDDDEETLLLPSPPIEMITEEKELPIEKTQPLVEVDDEEQVTGSLPAPEVIVGKMISFPAESVAQTRDDIGAESEPSVITEKEERPFEIKEPTFELVSEGEEERQKFPLTYLLFGVMVAALVVGLIALLTSGDEVSDQEAAADAGATKAALVQAAAEPTESKPVKVADAGVAAAASEPPQPIALVAPPEAPEPSKPAPKEIVASRAVEEKQEPERKVEKTRKTRKTKTVKKKRRKSGRKKSISSRKRGKKTANYNKRSSSKKKKSSGRKSKSRSKRSSSRKKKTTKKASASKASTTLIVDGVPVKNLSGLERKLRPGMHVMELRDKNGKVLRRWKVRVGEEK